MIDGLQRLEGDFGHLFHKEAVNLLLDSSRPFIGHLGGDGVFLLVCVIDNGALFNIGGKQAHDVGAEILGYHDGGVVSAGLHALQGFVPACKLPVHLVVGFQGVYHLVAHVHAHGEDLPVIARVGVGHRDFDVLCIAVGVPAPGDIKPGVHGRHNADAHHDNEGNGVIPDTADVSGKYFQDFFHFSVPFQPSLNIARISSSVMPQSCCSISNCLRILSRKYSRQMRYTEIPIRDMIHSTR